MYIFPKEILEKPVVSHVSHVSASQVAFRLDATDVPAPGFVQAFCASQQLSQQLAAERHCNANGQAVNLPTASHGKWVLCCNGVFPNGFHVVLVSIKSLEFFFSNLMPFPSLGVM